MSKETECPYYQEDEWGICHFKIKYENEDCENNCAITIMRKNKGEC